MLVGCHHLHQVISKPYFWQDSILAPAFAIISLAIRLVSLDVVAEKYDSVGKKYETDMLQPFWFDR